MGHTVPRLWGKLANIGCKAVDVKRWCALSIAAFAAPSSMAFAASPTVYTPAPGSAERIAIVKSLHAGDDGPQSRFTFRQFRVSGAGARKVAYVQAAGPTGDFQAILQRDRHARWRKVWGEGDGGSNSCADGARHYSWALRLLLTYTVAPGAIFPGVVARTNDLKRMANSDPNMQCVGDLDGGPM
jgi:hypothetical protein